MGSLANRASNLLLSSSSLKNKNSSSSVSVPIEGLTIQAEDHQLAFVAPDEVSNFSDIALCQDFQQAVVLPMATFRTAKEISSILNSYYLNSAWIDRSSFFGGGGDGNNNKNKNNNEQQVSRRNRLDQQDKDDDEDDLIAEHEQKQSNNKNNNENDVEHSLFSVIPLRNFQDEFEQEQNINEDDDNNDGNKNKNVTVSEIIVGKDVRVIIHEDPSSGTTTVTVRWKSHRKSDIMSDVIVAALLLSDSTSIQNNNNQQQQEQDQNNDQIENNNNNNIFSQRFSLLRSQRQNNNSNNNNNKNVVGKENERLQPSDSENMIFRYQCFHRMLRQHFPSVKVNLRDGSALIVVPNHKSNNNHNNQTTSSTAIPQKWHVAIEKWIYPRVLEEELDLTRIGQQNGDDDDASSSSFVPKLKMPESLKRRIGYTLQRIYLAINPIPFDEGNGSGMYTHNHGAQLLEGGGWCRCEGC